MGDLSTVAHTGDRVRCCCGAWYERLGDDGRGAWIFEDGVTLPAGYCKSCAPGRYGVAVGASQAASVPDAETPPPTVPAPQTPRERVRRRRSDVPTTGGNQ